MISQDQVPNIIDHMVYDTDGKKIGEARHVYLDDASGEPEWATVRTGFLGSQESFVPIHDARLVENHVEVRYPKAKVKDSPHIDADRGRLTEQQERELYNYYEVDWDAAWRRSGGEDASTAPGSDTAPLTGTDTTDTGTGTGTGASSGTGSGADVDAGTTTGTQAGKYTGARAGAGAGIKPEAQAGAPTLRSGEEPLTDQPAGTAEPGGPGGDAMTRSEEYLRVGTERRESGRARLHKYVVTEEVQQTVPLRHEEVRVEREPITEANVDEALSGPEIAEDEHEVVLHEERAVVETEAVPVERVRMVPEEYTEEETVHGEIRKERIEVEGVEEVDHGDDSSGGHTYR